MKIGIIGSNSKIAKVIENSIISKNNIIFKYSQRDKEDFEELKHSDVVIYLVSNTNTVPKLQTYTGYIYSNCFLLGSNFLAKN